MKDFQNIRSKIIEKTEDIKEFKHYMLFLIGSIPVLSIFSISYYFMHPALQ